MLDSPIWTYDEHIEDGILNREYTNPRNFGFGGLLFRFYIPYPLFSICDITLRF